MSRLKRLPGDFLTLLIGLSIPLGCYYYVMNSMSDGSSEYLDVLALHALQTRLILFHAKYERYPETLYELTQPGADGTPPILKDEAALMDRWGQRFNYDPKQLNPKNDVPLIWTDGPPGKKKRITNWE